MNSSIFKKAVRNNELREPDEITAQEGFKRGTAELLTLVCNLSLKPSSTLIENR